MPFEEYLDDLAKRRAKALKMGKPEVLKRMKDAGYAVREAVDHEGIYTQWIYLKDLNDEAEAFHAKYMEKFDEDTDVVRAYGYSFAYAIKEAAELAKSNTDSEAIRDAMYKIKFDSVFGQDSHFDELGQVVWPRPVLVKTEDGDLARVWQN